MGARINMENDIDKLKREMDFQSVFIWDPMFIAHVFFLLYMDQEMNKWKEERDSILQIYIMGSFFL